VTGEQQVRIAKLKLEITRAINNVSDRLPGVTTTEICGALCECERMYVEHNLLAEGNADGR
jgi:hypothetical protein